MLNFNAIKPSHKKDSQNQRSVGRQWFSSKTEENVLNRLKSRQSGWGMVFIVMVMLFNGCASVQPPTGGPKDVDPPKLLNVNPKNLTTNFNSKKITFLFDEYFKLQNEFKEITYSPEIENIPVLKQKGKELELTFQEPLLPNTTYTINFGNAIADVNETNVLKNFTYVFATGDELDSLSISGKVISATTALPEKEILVFVLPEKQDSLFGKKKPIIFTKTDTAGRFGLNNLREDKYKIYALQDNNADRLYQQGVEEIGFLNSAITLNKNQENINLKIFKEAPILFRNIDRKINNDGTIFLTFNRTINKPSINIIDPKDLNDTKIVLFNKTIDTAKIWVKEIAFDSIKVAIKEQDTILQTVNLLRAKRDTYSSTLTPKFNLLNDFLLHPNTDLILTFDLPIVAINKDKLVLKEDSLTITNYKTNYDTLNPTRVNISYPWKEKAKYELLINEGAFKSIYNYNNKGTIKKFERGLNKDYGRIDITYKTTDSLNKGYIVEMINADKELIKSDYITNDTTIIYNQIRVGKYYIRIIYDENLNKKWDTGILKSFNQPETIWFDPRGFTIRPNWEVKEVINIPKIN
ncbi:Ig-like domain-containing protein [Pedobacter flavus]|uniref:Ig-like domain-containing protein n=1 Tax=Pedobacter flavus TaxID=3113906 RepID=A0ABU7GZJ0_9SPHI|nr:Ig-like domain-containing protein [Pedobacter sp. VNH31]MEE1884454.1 Ig-like domain-containing protein [Pedobacter sp. VNH31]